MGICIGYEFFVTTWDESCVESQELTQLPPYADNVANSDFESRLNACMRSTFEYCEAAAAISLAFRYLLRLLLERMKLASGKPIGETVKAAP